MQDQRREGLLVAILMNGNGRWAARPARITGHLSGSKGMPEAGDARGQMG